MENKHKNALIGALLAVVFVMAVGYAAFAQNLQINGEATVSSTWNVHFDKTKTNAVSAHPGVTGTGGQQPSGQITKIEDYAATCTADLKQPGDYVTFTFTVLNEGSIDAVLTQPVIASEPASSNRWITWTVSEFDTDTNLAATSGSRTFTLTATYNDVTDAPTVEADKTVSATVTFSASQKGA